MRKLIAVWLLVGAFIACSQPDNHPAIIGDCPKCGITIIISGGGDSGTQDATSNDTGTVDTGTVDTGILDVVIPDVGLPDVLGLPDAGSDGG